MTSRQQPALSPPLAGSSPITNPSRFSLRLRQQPGASAVSLNVQDRWPISPSPVLQLMINGFNPRSPTDIAEIRSVFWVVHCRLVAVQSFAEDGTQDVHRSLMGTSVTTPLSEADRLAGGMPVRLAAGECQMVSDDPNPLLPSIRSVSAQEQIEGGGQIPSCLFVFSDLCVSKVGEYRLEFRLMKMEAHILTHGSALAILDTVTSDAFTVMTVEDYTRMQL